MNEMEKGEWTTGSFRPKTFDEMALYPELKDLLNMYADNGMYQHLIMVGGFGTGKTTAARILSNSDKFSVIEVACNEKSDAATIDAIIKQSTSWTAFGKPRLYIMDEWHDVKKSQQIRLKKILEDRKEYNKFIFIVNDYKKVDDAIKSRTAKLVFDIGFLSDRDNTFTLYEQNTDMTIDEWKQELKRIARLVSNRAGYEAPDEMINKVLSINDNIKDTRSFLIALQMRYNIDQMKNKT
jgi:replication-associated recombination protein RarA